MNEVLVADARRIPLADESVHLVITSPPYWAQRKYEGLGDDQLGLEPTSSLFIEHMVGVFHEVRRVLRQDGCCIINLGDSYASRGQARNTEFNARWGNSPGQRKQEKGRPQVHGVTTALGFKAKDKCLIPHRVAIALQEDGWIVRADVPCLKVAAMPESVHDRPSTAHEYIFMLVKQPHYYWDADAIRRPSDPTRGHGERESSTPHQGRLNDPNKQGAGFTVAIRQYNALGRNFRTTDLILDEDGEPLVYLWHPQPFPGAHFATFPIGLAEPWVRAACPERVCVKCGRGWVRVVEKTGERIPEWQRACGGDADGEYDGQAIKEYAGTGAENASDVKRRILAGMVEKTHRWEPACKCGAPTQPGIVLDPFTGSGTVGVVCARWNRQFVGLDLSPTYAAMAQERIRQEGLAETRHVEPGGATVTQLTLGL